ncbi:MAG: cobaltochelatase subunit CobN [Dehalococcoidia bacterium]|nr:cobaltochelatase subunit CobN [Dehalococcoidia bacterium]
MSELIPLGEVQPERTRPVRNVVTRADGKLVNVNRQMGQLFVCAHGCCCGKTEEGKPEGHFDVYQEEWERRRIRNKVHLNMGGCLGPCPLANVCMLLFEGRTTFFHSMNTPQRIVEIYDYIETMIASERYLPPPPALRDFAFSAMRNDGRPMDVLPEPAPASGEQQQRGGEPGPILFLTHADTDVLAISAIRDRLDPQVTRVHVQNIGHLRDGADALALFGALIPGASIVVVNLHGGMKSLPGFADIVAMIEREGCWLIALPGIDELDPELTAHSNTGVAVALATRAYLQAGGPENYRQCIHFLCDHLLTTGIGYELPVEQPREGVCHPRVPSGRIEDWRAIADPAKPTIGITFYRSYWLSGDTAFIDTLVEAGEALGANVLPVFGYSLKDDPGDHGLPGAMRFFVDEDGRPVVDVVVNTMAFAMGSSRAEERTGNEWVVEALETLGIPQVQALNTSISSERWLESENGVPPLDVAMNVAIPELDGRIISVPVSFKEVDQASTTPGLVRRLAVRDRAERVMGTAFRLAMLRRTPNAEKRIVVMLTNHHAKAARIANAVGLDAPESLLALLSRMREVGYDVGEPPADADELMHLILARGHYDADVLSDEQLRDAIAHVPASRYRAWFAELPERRQAEMREQWGEPPGQHYVDQDGAIALAGLRFGNVFVAVQPPRGYGMDKTAIMHKPHLPPPYPYHALYRWLREPAETGGFGADAVIQMGKHGSLEWLPGKGVGLSADCYPDLFLGDLPVVYPFIIDGPGEGAAAKRRTHATIVDHLPPPITNAELYGELAELDRLVDEYYLLERTDPAKLPVLQKQVWDLLREANLDGEIANLMRHDDDDDDDDDHVHEWDERTHADGVPYTISDLSGADFAHLVEDIHAYTHELGAAPLRLGLHCLGEPPVGDDLADTLQALVRFRNGNVPSLREALAAAYDVDLDVALAAPGTRLDAPPAGLATDSGAALHANADVLDALDTRADALLRGIVERDGKPNAVEEVVATVLPNAVFDDGIEQVRAVLAFVSGHLLPALQQTTDEVEHILDALEGRYVPPGPSGALTRGMAHALPTGRNFYAIDPRSLPSPTAWIVGQGLADGVVERYVADEGRVPETVGVSIWGTAAMRTAGEDLAQVFALLGVRPVWQRESRRVAGVEAIPLAELGRPRVDVVCRISGFFRDAFPTALALLDDAVNLVADLDEPADQNFVRAHRRAEADRLAAEEGLDAEAAWRRAGYRIFGSQPGVYGAGILQLIDERNWRDDADLALTYINWGGYAYTRNEFGADARDAFRTALGAVNVAVKNQDNREHDIFDSDDYLQFHGGMIAAVRAITGQAPRRYFGDTHDPDRPQVRDLKQEVDRVFRTRVVNPKWLNAIMQHGYRGGTELTATVDYLFGYDATARVLDDWQYEKVAEAYALDPTVREFLGEANPWALRDIASRLLEAMDRDLWTADEGTRRTLQSVFLEAEGRVEDAQGGAPL